MEFPCARWCAIFITRSGKTQKQTIKNVHALGSHDSVEFEPGEHAEVVTVVTTVMLLESSSYNWLIMFF